MDSNENQYICIWYGVLGKPWTKAAKEIAGSEVRGENRMRLNDVGYKSLTGAPEGTVFLRLTGQQAMYAKLRATENLVDDRSGKLWAALVANSRYTNPSTSIYAIGDVLSGARFERLKS